MARPEGDEADGGRGQTDFGAAPPESVSLDLVRRIQQGDSGAWNELFARYHDPLLLAVRVRLGPGLRRFLTSEDIFQSVALEAMRSLEQFEARGPGSLESYLRTLVVNKIRDRVDTFTAEKRGGGAPHDVPLDEALAESLAAHGPAYHDGERYERLERALNALAPDQRELIVLRRLENLSSQEVAARLGVSDDAARKAFSRAMARLTTLLAADGG